VRADLPLGRSILAAARASNLNAALAAKTLTAKAFNKVRANNHTELYAGVDEYAFHMEAALTECHRKLQRAQERERQLSQMLINRRH
jgi:hypothetical protein